MKTTTNYGFKKPEVNDYYNVNDLNESLDIIDTELKTMSDKASTVSAHIANVNNPHKTTAAQVGLGNVPNVSTNNQTPSYTVASANAALSSGEKLSVAFGKIAKAVSSLISHLADTTVHVTSSERTTWNGKANGTHTHTKSEVGLSNVPNLATNDQTPTYTVASSNTALASGEKLSVAFGKIAKAVNSLISHLADTVGHITSAERTAWNGKLDATAKAVDSDKLDGCHATDFKKTDDIRVLVNNEEYPTVETDIRTLLVYKPSGVYTFATTTASTNIKTPFTDGVGMLIQWDRMDHATSRFIYGICTIRSMTNNSNWAVSAVYNSGMYTDWVTPLHTGNSAKVIISDTEPTDTKALWIS